MAAEDSAKSVGTNAVRRQIAKGSLIKVLDEFVEHSGIFRAVWPSSQYMSPKLRAFVDYLSAHLIPKTPPEERRANGARRRRDCPSRRSDSR
jgi:DNA-binding transcriptional LysR family regulator